VYAANNQPLFQSCSNSIVAYSGDYYGAPSGRGFNINYQCFTPASYQNLLTSRGKLARIVELCQDTTHNCRRVNNGRFNTAPGNNNAYSGLPQLANLKVITTAKYYQWYSQYVNLAVVNNVVRCPTSFRGGRGNSCNCDRVVYPELFSSSNPAMPSANSDRYKVVDDVPSPIAPYSSYARGFIGNFSTAIVPGPTVTGNVAALLAQARLVIPSISNPVFLGCIDESVDLTNECDDDDN